MAKAIVYCILVVVLIAVHSTTGLFANIHMDMTKDEKLTVFGSEDSVPEYEVFPMSLMGMERSIKSNENIKCTLNLNGKEIELNLKPTTQYLATKYVPVWSAVSDRHAYKKIRYKPLSTAMSDVGDFTMYQDAKNEAALAVYTDRTEKIVIEGIVTSRYTIRSLPNRLTRKFLNKVRHIRKISNVMGGTIRSDEDAGFYVVTKDPDVPVSTTVRAFVTSHEPAEPTEPTITDNPGDHEEGTTVPTTVSTHPESHEPAGPTEHEDRADPGHHEDRTTAPTTVGTHPESHEPAGPTEHEDRADPGHHKDGTTARTTVGTHPESHEPVGPTEHEDRADPGHHKDRTTAPTTVGTHPESHEPAGPTEHEDRADPGHHEDGTTAPTTVGTHPESHELAEPTEHEDSADPGHHEDGTTAPTTVGTHPESHEPAGPTEHEDSADPGHHEDGTTAPTTVGTHPESHELAEPTEHEDSADPGHHEDGTTAPTTVGAHPESHEPAGPTEHEDRADPGHHVVEMYDSIDFYMTDPGHHEDGTTAPTTVGTHPESHEPAGPTEHEDSADPGHHKDGTTAPTTVGTHPESHEPAGPTEHEDRADPGRHVHAMYDSIDFSAADLGYYEDAMYDSIDFYMTDPGHHEEGTTAPTTADTLVKNHEPAEPAEHGHDGESEHHERKKRAKGNKGKQKVPKTVYSEMLIILDHNTVRHPTITRALRRTLAFWNAVDLIYSTLNKPKIHLNIAGIIIAADDMATPYIAKNTSVSSIGNLDSVLLKMGKYFYKESVRFPIKNYDTIIAMTTMNLCAGKVDSCKSSEIIPGHSNGLAVCSSQPDITKTKTLKNTMIMHYDEKFGPEHLYFVHHGDGYGKNSACISKTHDTTDNNPSFKWSKCSQKLHSRSLASKKTACLQNKPLSIEPVDEVLPGRWLSIDGQCQNEGFAESCKLKKRLGTCVAKGCRAKGSKKCVRSKKAPLSGSKCGTTKYCNQKKQCRRK